MDRLSRLFPNQQQQKKVQLINLLEQNSIFNHFLD